ncbi:hypothetical protein KJ909_01845 [Patescibacteria group bacterium]|nr:hypothetical protein [Patescibacteria group bacterium]
MLALVNGIPQTLNLRQFVLLFLRHRQTIIRRRTLFDLKSAYMRHHILEGLKIALDNLDAIIKTIRASKTVEAARENLISKFKLTDLQANAILEMQLRRLAALERQKIEDEYESVGQNMKNLTDLITKEPNMISELKSENKRISLKYADSRRTKIYSRGLKDFSEEDLVADVSTFVTMTKTGYIKRVAKDTYRTQKRGGIGVIGMITKQEDEIDAILSVHTHDDLLFFTNKGRVFKTKVWEIEEGSRQTKGQALINLINLTPKENVQAVLPINKKNSDKKYILLATQNGIVKKTPIKQFQNIRQSGLIAIKLDKNDELTWAKLTTGNDFVFLVSQKGKCIRFSEIDARSMGRHTRGVRGIHLKKDDTLVSMNIVPPENKADKTSFQHILVVTQNGIGKRTNAYLYPLQKRGGIGVKVSALSKKTGDVTAAQVVNQNDEQVIIASKHAITIRLPLKNIPQLSRNTKGVILMRFKNDQDHVNAMTVIENLTEEN